MRLNKFIAITLPTSRRKADELIRNNLIRVNDMIAKIGDTVEENIDQVMYIDKKLIFSSDYKYFKFYKHHGYICSTKRQGESKTIYSIVKDRSLKYGGRLDKDSEGLLILSNNGDWLETMMHPRNEIKKIYHVTTKENINLNNFKKNISISDKTYALSKIQKIKDRTYEATLSTGKNREIRNIFKYNNIEISSLKRVSIGNFELEDMRPGELQKIKVGA